MKEHTGCPCPASHYGVCPSPELAHTPGPWTVELVCDVLEPEKSGDKTVVVKRFHVRQDGGTQFIVAEIIDGFSKTFGTPERNARLIAAAPELLQALREIRAALEDQRPHKCAGFDCSYCNPNGLRDIAGAAIEKATVRA